jgi:hypothetical protein
LTKNFKKKPCRGYSSKNSFTFWQNFEPKKCCVRLVHLTSCWVVRSIRKAAVTYGQQCHYHIISYALLKPTKKLGEYKVQPLLYTWMIVPRIIWQYSETHYHDSSQNIMTSMNMHSLILGHLTSCNSSLAWSRSFL